MEAINQVVRPHRMDENNNEKNIIWQDVKDFVNGLSETQLQQEVLYWGELQSGGFFAITILGDDFINPDGEGVEPVSESYLDIAEREPVVFKKGTIIFDINDDAGSVVP